MKWRRGQRTLMFMLAAVALFALWLRWPGAVETGGIRRWEVAGADVSLGGEDGAHRPADEPLIGFARARETEGARPSVPATRPVRGTGMAPAPSAEIEDPTLSALAEVEALEDAAARSSAFSTLLAGLSIEDGYRLLRRFDPGQPSFGTSEIVTLLLHRLAEVDGARFEEWARGLREGAGRAAAFTALALQRSRADGPSALEWARGLASASSSSEAVAVMQVAIEFARTDPAVALDLAAGLPASAPRDQTLTHCVAQWAAVEPSEALRWAKRIKDIALRDRLVGRVLTAMAEREPRAAADWTAAALPSGAVQSRVAVAVAQRWAQTDPASARSWVETFPDERLRRDALAAVEQVTSSP